jgi:hypothetical protein
VWRERIALAVEVDSSFSVRMSGPVVRVGEGELSPECLEGA